jgi:hypothetical protein
MSYQRLFDSEAYLSSQNDTDHPYRKRVVPPSTGFNAAALMSGTTSEVSFDLNGDLDRFFLRDSMSIFLRVNITNTHGTLAATPCFAETIFDQNAFQWSQGGQEIIYHPVEQVAYEPPIFLTNDQYAKLCKTLNHDAAMTPGSSVSLAAGASTILYVRVPNFLPRKGFPFCALNGNYLRLRSRLQNALSAGTGTLTITDIALEMIGYDIPSNEIEEIRRDYSSAHWYNVHWAVNRPGSQITLTATGDSPSQKLDQLKNVPAILMFHIPRANRNVTANGFFNYAALGAAAKFRVTNKSGTTLFASNADYVQNLRHVDATLQILDSNFFSNCGVIPTFIEENIQQAIYNNHNTGVRVLTGDELDYITDSGLTTSIFLDTVALYHMTYVMQDGIIKRVIGLVKL